MANLKFVFYEITFMEGCMRGPSSAHGQSATNAGLSVTKGEQGHLQCNNRAGQVVR